MGSEAKVSPSLNPNYIADNELDWDICEFHSKVFVISSLNGLDQTDDYNKLIQSMYPYEPTSKIMLNPMGNAITKTWTKENDLLIHVEWVIMHSQEPEEGDADSHKY